MPSLVTGQVAGNKAQSASVSSGTLPVAPTPGNVLVVDIQYDSSTATTYSLTGWTQISSAFSSARGWCSFYRVVQSGDTSGPYTFTGSQIAYYATCIREFTGVNTSSPIDQVNAQYQSASTFNTPTVTPSGSNRLPIASFGNGNTATISGIGASWTQDYTTGGAVYYEITTQEYTGLTGSPISASVTWGSTVAGIASIILLAPSTGTIQIERIAQDMFGRGVIFAYETTGSSSTLTATVSDTTKAAVSPASQTTSGQTPVEFIVTPIGGASGDTQVTISNGTFQVTLTISLGYSQG